MNKRRLGRTSLQVTEIGLGANAVGGHNLYENLSDADGVAVVRQAIGLGVNFIDTADVYGLGRSEELIGEALRGAGAEVLVATKGGNEWDPVAKERRRVNNRPEYLRRALEASLRRLGREAVDLYYIHRVDDDTPLCDSFGELQRLKVEGKIRAAGLSNVTVAHVQAAMCGGTVDAVQNEYHLFSREPEEELIPFCADNEISFIAYGPLAFGLLGGKYKARTRLPAGDWRRRLPLFEKKNFKRALKVVGCVKEIADDRGAAPSHVAMRWALRWRAVASTIAGAKTPAQVVENARADSFVLSDEEIERVDHLTGDWLLVHAKV